MSPLVCRTLAVYFAGLLYPLLLVFSLQDSTASKLIVLTPLLIVVSLFIAATIVLVVDKRHYFTTLMPNLHWSLLLWLFLLVVAAFREVLIGANALAAGIRLLLICGLLSWALMLAHVAKQGYSLSRVVNAALLGCQIIVLVNICLFVLGIEGAKVADSQSAQLLRYLGILSDRVRFFLSDGVNNYASVASVVILGSYWRLKIARSYTAFFFQLACLVAGAISLLLVDSRTAVAAVFAAIFIVETSIIKMRLIPLIFTTSPFWIFFLTSVNLKFLEFLSRNSYDLLTFGGRSVFWIAAVADIFPINSTHIFGGGLFYQPELFSYITADSNFDTSSVYFSVHNSLLQIFMQTGLVGCIIYLSVIYVSFKQVKTNLLTSDAPFDTWVRKFISCILIFSMIAGGLESILSPISSVFFLIMISLIPLHVYRPLSKK